MGKTRVSDEWGKWKSLWVVAWKFVEETSQLCTVCVHSGSLEPALMRVTLCVCAHVYTHAHMRTHMNVKAKGQFVETGSLPVVEFSN